MNNYKTANYKSSDITSWYQSLDPAVRDAAVRGLIGSAVGAGALGGVSAATSTGDHQTKRVLGNALMGALLGGVGAAGVPAGWNMITGKTRLPGEHNKPIISRSIDMLGQPFTTHPATTAGLGVGAYFGMAGRVPLREAWGPALNLMKDKADAAHYAAPYHAKPLSNTSNKLRALVYMYLNPDKAMAEGATAKQMLSSKNMAVAAGKEVGPFVKDLATHTGKGVRGLYALPVALGAGWLLDRYLKGKY